MSDVRASLAKQAWALHLAGVPVEQISEHTNLSVVQVAEVISRRAPTAGQDGQGAAVELARVAELWRVVYPVAIGGDTRAADLALRLSEKRMALAEVVERESAIAVEDRPTPVCDATEASIAAAVEAGRLDATVSAGPLSTLRAMAAAIDRPGFPIIAGGKFDNVTVPTYLRLCAQLNLTPAQVKEPKTVKKDDGDQPPAERGGRLAQLRAVRPSAAR